MSHPRVEEVSDSDDNNSDPSEGDIDEFDDTDIIQRINPQQQRPATQTLPSRPAPAQQQHLPQQQHVSDASQFADFQCLYPVYFDATRTRAEGRRVKRSEAVRNPLAREIAQACGNLQLQALFEPTKTHPRDWANPGRVKVKVKGSGNQHVKNKHHLYLLVAKHLRENPATENCRALRSVTVPGLQMPEAGKPWPKPAVPRGWKLGELVPHYSPAVTGGGVTENFLQDMMKDMQGLGGPGGAGDMASMLAAAAGQGAGSSGSGPSEEKKAKKKGKK
ncbi:hypothetical protein PspLS_06579 [Pyricularia sp. CBS 133598]|nr:hypothetical protein PspLS_06579 [Pyricularia sp. CBS 133598]